MRMALGHHYGNNGSQRMTDENCRKTHLAMIQGLQQIGHVHVDVGMLARLVSLAMTAQVGQKDSVAVGCENLHLLDEKLGAGPGAVKYDYIGLLGIVDKRI